MGPHGRGSFRPHRRGWQRDELSGGRADQRTFDPLLRVDGARALHRSDARREPRWDCRSCTSRSHHRTWSRQPSSTGSLSTGVWAKELIDGYRLVQTAEGSIGGGLLRTPEGVFPYVTIYVSVDDLRATPEKAEELGGKIEHQFPAGRRHGAGGEGRARSVCR